MYPLTALTRSNRVESIHQGYICIVDSDNRVRYSLGDPEAKIYFRSCAKPFQAVPFVASGAMEKYRVTPQELAVICGSHSGEPAHLETVSSILNKLGLHEENLECGAAEPYNRTASDELIRMGRQPSKLHNCCSGKHAAMLALCKFYGYPLADYIHPEHPVQQLLKKTIAELLHVDPASIPTGTDGCGVPSYVLTLQQGAYLYSLLSLGYRGNNHYAHALGTIAQAMTAYPYMVNGQEEFCTDLMAYMHGRVVGKVGAEGIYGVAVPEKRLGICVKIADGNERGIYPVIMHILYQLGLLGLEEMKNLKNWAFPPIKNHRGSIVGYNIPIFDITINELPEVKTGDEIAPDVHPVWKHERLD